jgi:hypothetical protein
VSDIINPDDSPFIFQAVDNPEAFWFAGFEAGQFPLKVVPGKGVFSKQIQGSPDDFL